MFTWICPKCGGEVPPAYNECPRCNPPKRAEAETARATPPQTAPAAQPVSKPVSAPASTPIAMPISTPVYKPAPVPQPMAPRPQPTVANPPVREPEPLRYAAPPPPPPLQPQEPPPQYAPPVAQPVPAAGHFTYERPAAQPRRQPLSPALVGIGAAVGVVALLAVLYLYVLPHRGSEAAADAKGEATKLEPVTSSTRGAHPLAKHIEVTGVRIQEQTGGKVRIDFVVVNHSAGDLPPLKMDVRVLSGSREYFSIPVSLPSLGPFESREMTTNVKTALKPYELPDWQLVQSKFTVHD